MLAIITSLGVCLVVALYLGVWIWDKTDPDPYDNPDNWGDQP
jgi:hypothetical protein